MFRSMVHGPLSLNCRLSGRIFSNCSSPMQPQYRLYGLATWTCKYFSQDLVMALPEDGSLYDPKHVGVKEFYMNFNVFLINMCMSWLLLTLGAFYFIFLQLVSILEWHGKHITSVFHYYTNIWTNKWCIINITITPTCFSVNTPSSWSLQLC